jgi:N-acetyl-anhydromuramyl-L-alanine amidase AmpD
MELYKRGSRGEMVRQIQKALNLYPDGIYGVITEEAVKSFQMRHGLKPDGIVGPATLAKLIPARLKRSKRTITEIIIHCTATPEGRDYTIYDIRKWHTDPPPKGNGWSDIGYHYVVYRNGRQYEGRDVDIIGAHCKNHNAHSIGICYVGGTDAKGKPKDTRTLQQKAGLLTLLEELKKLYPNAKIYGHHDFEPGKPCPCFDAKAEYKDL